MDVCCFFEGQRTCETHIKTVRFPQRVRLPDGPTILTARESWRLILGFLSTTSNQPGHHRAFFSRCMCCQHENVHHWKDLTVAVPKDSFDKGTVLDRQPIISMATLCSTRNSGSCSRGHRQRYDVYYCFFCACSGTHRACL